MDEFKIRKKPLPSPFTKDSVMAFFKHLSFTLKNQSFVRNSLSEFSTTITVAPISAKMAIHKVNQPGIINRRANTFKPNANATFWNMTFNVFLLKAMV